ncbi:TetR/AcrR family transcriptional regulator [Kordiimonas marina]|uniref:TetR/AcrR family transcriptional regulator n=1 Tax=Kordiimonas marina TaxID=2872312 RepID=UPI001FF6AEBF|nr:TetR/AcrR family transcriptional regulator [Kordiimonas marina]MCJ9429426.1 TetR/AcrR family transcriptional regulator [Kordiimonas marina]
MSKTPEKRRRVGRPKDGSGDDRKVRLVQAAGPVFARQGFGATKIADLAAAAGVTPAMVHYYFGGKEDLLKAAFEEAFAPILAELDKPTTLEDWVTLFHANIMEKRWLPHLMLREVIMEGGHLRAHFATHFGSRFVQKWLTMLEREKAEGRLREDADDFRHIVILMGMVIYPFVVAPMSGYLTGVPFGDEDMIRFRDDALRLYFKGAKG